MAASSDSNLTGIGLWGLDALAATTVIGVKGSEAFGRDITAFAQRSIEAGVEAAKRAFAADSLTEAAETQAAHTNGP